MVSSGLIPGLLPSSIDTKSPSVIRQNARKKHLKNYDLRLRNSFNLTVETQLSSLIQTMAKTGLAYPALAGFSSQIS